MNTKKEGQGQNKGKEREEKENRITLFGEVILNERRRINSIKAD